MTDYDWRRDLDELLAEWRVDGAEAKCGDRLAAYIESLEAENEAIKYFEAGANKQISDLEAENERLRETADQRARDAFLMLLDEDNEKRRLADLMRDRNLIRAERDTYKAMAEAYYPLELAAERMCEHDYIEAERWGIADALQAARGAR